MPDPSSLPPVKAKRGRPRNPFPRGTTQASRANLVKELALLCTFANYTVRKRLIRECEDGTIHPMVFKELLHYAGGVPKQTLEIEDKQTVLLVLRHELGYDPLPPREPAAQAKPVGRGKTEQGSLVPIPPGAEVGR